MQGGLSASVAIHDERAEQAMRLLAMDDVESGESGAAGVGGLLELLTGPEAAVTRRRLGVTAQSTVLAISTEGRQTRKHTPASFPVPEGPKGKEQSMVRSDTCHVTRERIALSGCLTPPA
ncbi:hypothetical protein ACFSC4_25880 [Deinococcus malanensis]|uniref:hypothetical protein n=1 Tax=Deinococcus malanensis TaxID=1706855 RepID=UPI0036270CC8